MIDAKTWNCLTQSENEKGESFYTTYTKLKMSLETVKQSLGVFKML